MKIKKLHVTNFRTIEVLEVIDPPEAIAVLGYNGQGKTSMLAALRYALLGYCEFTDRAGRGAECLIRHGADEAEVTVEVEHNQRLYTIEVVIKCAGQANERNIIDHDTGEVLTGQAFWAALGIDPRTAEPSLTPAAFLDHGNRNAASDTLAAWAQGTVSMDEVKIKAGAHWPHVEVFAAEKSVLLRSAADLAHLGKLAADVRKELNAEVKRDKAVLESLPHAPQPVDRDGNPVTLATRPGILKGLEQLEKQVNSLHRAIGVVEGGGLDAGAIEGRRGELLDSLEKADSARQEAAEAHAAALEVRQAAEAKLEAAQVAHATAVRDENDKQRAHKKALEEAKGLLEVGATCPTCGCTVTQELVARLSEAMSEVQAGIALALKGMRQAVKDRLAEVTAAHETMIAAKTAEQSARAALGTQETACARLEGEIAALPAPYTGPSMETLQGELEATEARLAAGRALLERLDAWQERQAAEHRAKENQARAAEYDWMVKALRDGELLRGMLVAELERGLVEPVNTVLNALVCAGCGIAVAVEGKEIGLLFREDGAHEYRPVRLCSEGERALVQYGLAIAFSKDTGVPVLLDDINALDVRRRGGLLKNLRYWTDATVVVAGAWQQTDTDWERIARALHPVMVVVAADRVLRPLGVTVAV